MNIVNAGSKFQIFGEDLKTYKRLPTLTYSVGFNPMQGFWLTQRHDLDPREEKVYGGHAERVNKVFKAFKLSNRNFGIILSGKKGIGKSLFAQLIAERAIEEDLPVIIVDTAIPGISDFLGSIEQEVVIIFDEFEKTFNPTEDGDPQVELLSLFDGMDSGKKLFVVTCNEPKRLNEFFINRPGRFHYHFTLGCPDKDEVRAYMSDKLGDGFDEEIEKVIKLSQMADISYDCLRAIAFDLRMGYSLEESLNDLNINYERDCEFDITIRLKNGAVYTAYSQRIDLYDKCNRNARFYLDKGAAAYLTFTPSKVDLIGHTLALPTDSVTFVCAWDAYDDIGSEEEAEKMRKAFNEEAEHIESITLTKVFTSSVSKYIDV